MARANLKKVNSSQLLLPQHQSTYPRGPESVSIEISPFRPHFIKFSKTVFYQVNLVSHCLHLEVLLVSKFGSEKGILIDAGMYFDAGVVFVKKTSFFFQEQIKFVQGTTFVQFYMYCKAKKKFGAIRKFLKIFIFENLLNVF